MMETIRLIGRGSRLSVLQMEKVARKIESVFPTTKVEIITRNSKGDALQDVPLHTVEGSDFFTQDIFDALSNNEADIAVHSLKDMSSEHFFGSNAFAVVDRNDIRDIAIFHREAEEKIKNGEKIIIGTCSPRREEMAIGFLQKALPQLNTSFKVETKNIRGNVDTRLRKLDAGEYDGIILATAGLNRLLESEQDGPAIKKLLSNKRLMLLPLIECVPAPCQGAIVAEASRTNQKAIEVLNKINDPELMEECRLEKTTAGQYGAGCLQRFGVTSISYGNNKVLYAAGKDSRENSFSNWSGLPGLDTRQKSLFSTTDFMGSFFNYEISNSKIEIKEPVAYIANYKAVEQKECIRQLQSKKVWASGTKTWFELSAKGIWVEGCADAFGLEFLQASWQMPLFTISKKDVAVITNGQSANTWQSKGWKVYATYNTTEKYSPEIGSKIKEADIIFWTSYRQYQQYKDVVKQDVQHSCPYGETAEQLKAAGIDPVVFPNIKAFQQWKQTYIRSTSAA
jgi:hydroxymethylbilane synthase